MRTMRGLRLVWLFTAAVCAVSTVLLIAQNNNTPGTDLSVRSSPPDTTPYVRTMVPEDTTAGAVGAAEAPNPALPAPTENLAVGIGPFGQLFIRDTVVSNTDPTLKLTD